MAAGTLVSLLLLGVLSGGAATPIRRQQLNVVDADGVTLSGDVNSFDLRQRARQLDVVEVPIVKRVSAISRARRLIIG